MAVLARSEDIWVAVLAPRVRMLLRPYICSPLGVGVLSGQVASCLMFVSLFVCLFVLFLVVVVAAGAGWH